MTGDRRQVTLLLLLLILFLAQTFADYLGKVVSIRTSLLYSVFSFFIINTPGVAGAVLQTLTD